MYQAGISEKLIQQRTGHRSLQGLRVYERTAQAQLVDISKVMSSEKDSGSVIGRGSIDSGASFASTGVGSIDSAASITSTSNVASTSSLNVATASKEKVPVLLSGCNFNGCTITFSGSATNISCDDNSIAADVLKGIDVNDLFDDF